MNEIEEVFISAFVQEDRQKPYRDLLSHPERRARFFNRLAKSPDLRPEVFLECEQESSSQVLECLHRNGAPDTCFVISACREIDGRVLPLADVVARVFARGD
ncbi:MAG: hypothetical protein EHM45_20540, partial [Desulfobacteraceae bacterium]